MQAQGPALVPLQQPAPARPQLQVSALAPVPIAAPVAGPVSTAAPSPAPAPATAAEAEARARKRQLEFLAEDCKRVCNAELNKPFSNLQNALDRLLPFHILGALDDGEADLEDTTDHAGQDLVCSREQAWSAVMLRHSVEAARSLEDIRRRVAAEQQRAAGHKGCTEDRLFIAKFLLEDSKARLHKQRTRPNDHAWSSDGEDDVPGLVGEDVKELAQAQQHARGPPQGSHLVAQAQVVVKQEAQAAPVAVLKTEVVASVAAVKPELQLAAASGPVPPQHPQPQQPQQQEVKVQAKEEAKDAAAAAEPDDAHALGGLGGLGDFGDTFDDDGLEEYVEDD